MLLGTLGASLVGNMLAEKGILRAGYGHGKEIVKSWLRIKKFFFDSTSSFNKL